MVNKGLQTSGGDNIQHDKATMKKIIALNLLAGWLAATAAFGQGYFTFETGKSQAYDGFTTPGVSTLSTNVDTSFLWGPTNTTPDVAKLTGLASTPANGNSSTFPPYLYYAYQAWNAILDGQFTLATNNYTGALVTQRTAANGSIAYNFIVSFPVTGTIPGATYTVYMISWDAQYATPQLAAAANGGYGSAVGWSTPFQYTPVIANGDSPLMAGVAAGFGTFAPPVAPEPTTLTLAVVGGLTLLAFRRK